MDLSASYQLFQNNRFEIHQAGGWGSREAKSVLRDFQISIFLKPRPALSRQSTGS